MHINGIAIMLIDKYIKIIFLPKGMYKNIWNVTINQMPIKKDKCSCLHTIESFTAVRMNTAGIHNRCAP